jgi:hypothetical protein
MNTFITVLMVGSGQSGRPEYLGARKRLYVYAQTSSAGSEASPQSLIGFEIPMDKIVRYLYVTTNEQDQERRPDRR